MSMDAACTAHSGLEPAPTRDVRFHLRWLVTRDLSAVLAIEMESFAAPWSEADFVDCLRHPQCVCMVAEHEGRVIGFAVYELSDTGIRILNLAVTRSCRRQGIASHIVHKLANKFLSRRRRSISLLVRETNLPGQLFFRAQGFRAVSTLRQFYGRGLEDAYLMRYRRPSGGDDRAIPSKLRASR